jgi:hypothetical protein
MLSAKLRAEAGMSAENSFRYKKIYETLRAEILASSSRASAPFASERALSRPRSWCATPASDLAWHMKEGQMEEVAADFYVATNGNDEWSGRRAQPSADGKDGPFATLERARDAVRALKQGETTVLIRGGTYRLRETVVFGLADSAPGGGRTTYAAYPGETPVFSSGVPISGWRELGRERPAALSEQAQANAWVADMPDGLGRFHVLFDGYRRLPRARSVGFTPTEPALSHADARPQRENDPRFSTLAFPRGTIRDWENLDDVEILIRPNYLWTMNILPLASVDEESCVARTAIPGTYPLRQVMVWREGRPLPESAWVENVLEALTGPGQWVVDTQTRLVYLWPTGDEPGQEILAPCLRELIRIEGRVDVDGPEDVPVRGLTFRGLTFCHADRGTWGPADAGIQHDWEMIDKADALVRMRGAEECSIERCTFTASGGSAVRLDLHCRGNLVAGNEINHLGGGGILLIGYGPGTKDVNRANRVYDNHIHHCGEIYWHSHAIVMWQSGDNHAAHNTIHHMPRKAFCLSGVRPWYFGRNNPRSRQRECGRSVRWHEITDAETVSACGDEIYRENLETVGWAPLMPYLHCRGNLIEENEVYRTNQILGDGSSINISGAGEGNVIRRNFVHDITNPWIHGAIRTDDFQRGTLIEENILHRISSCGLCLRHENYAVNNVIVDARPDHFVWIGQRPFDRSRIVNNIFLCSETMEKFYAISAQRKRSPIEHLAAMKGGEIDRNVYFVAGNDAAKAEVENLRSIGRENNGAFADPLFVDRDRGDFRLHEGSPALALGTRSVDLSGVGVRKGKRDWE